MSGLDLDTYQRVARTYADYGKDDQFNLVFSALGLCGEAGEFAERVKKYLRGKPPVLTEEKKRAMACELGDTLWYLAMCAHELGFNLSRVAEINVHKLQQRMLDGTLTLEDRPPDPLEKG